jgi:type I restriction enzyme, S subunit
LIELLKEKRQAVISHAVTKGLNPNAPMKPSGIQWLGDVPQHWELKPLKFLATFRSGGTPSKTVPAYWHGDVPWASSKDLKTETLADTIDHITQHALDSDAATLVPAGSVLVVVRGMILLHTFPVVQTLVPMAINQDLKALTPAECIHVSYLPWLLRGSTNATFGRIDEAAHGTKVLRMEAWTSIQLPVPPIEEQLEIVTTVEKQLETLSQLQAEAERAIELLQERRTALISAAVTGKIDVRQFAPVSGKALAAGSSAQQGIQA